MPRPDADTDCAPGTPGPVALPVAAQSRIRRLNVRNFIRGYEVLLGTLHRTVLNVAAHDCLNVAQSTAYSAIVALFPGSSLRLQ